MSEVEEAELKALMVAYGALTFAQVPSVYGAFTGFNRGLVESIFPPDQIPESYTREQIKDAAEVIFAMILERGDAEALDDAVAKARPEARVRIADSLAKDRQRHG